MAQSSENRKTSAFNTDGHGGITPQLSRGGPDVGGASGVPAPGVPAPEVPGVPAPESQHGGVGLSVRGPRGPSAGGPSMEGGLSARGPRGPRSSSSRGPSGPSGRDPSSRGPRGSSSKGLSMGTPATPVAGPLWVAGAQMIGSSVQFSSVAQSCLTLCNPMDCSMPGFPVHYQLLELAQTHVH